MHILSRVLRRVRPMLSRVAKATEAPPRYPGVPVTSVAELDAKLAEAVLAEKTSDDALRVVLDGFWMNIPAAGVEDPWGAEYRAHQMEMYRIIAGKDYALANEASVFDVPGHILRPFPYSTQSAATVGDQLMAIGYIIRAMDLPAGASILELGVGWGNTALHLAQMGYAVTAIDIEPRFLELVRGRAERTGVEIDLRQGDFFSLADVAEKFDAVLFYEAFHHCDDHQRLLRLVVDRLKPGGKLVLAGETIDARLPYPWGVNPAGIAVYSIRRWGWLELAFREEYLLETLVREGWRTQKHPCPLTAAGITYVSVRA